MFEFTFMCRDDFEKYGSALVSILYDNMEKIVPTGNSPEFVREHWLKANLERFDLGYRKSVMIRHKETGEAAGYFQYSIKENVLLMEDIQFHSLWKGKANLFRSLYGFVLENMEPGIAYVEAYASKNNAKPIGVLGKLGLSVVGENIRGTSYHFRGTYEDLLKWYQRK